MPDDVTAGDVSASGTTPEPASPRLVVDSTGNRFELLELIGEGGVAEVYRARDAQLDRIVALKRLTSTSPTAEGKLLREAQHQARVDHPYVCKVYGFGVVEGRPYLALQYCEAGTLAEHYHELGRSERIRLLQRVALAVDAAHQIGLIHRDLKPSNILLDREPTGEFFPLVSDFGLARAQSALATRTGLVAGTPAYMSPEQARGRRDVDHRTDIFALGATLYELVCERRAFPSDGDEPWAKVVERDPVPPRALDRTISRDLDAIIQTCLQKDPARRYPSARALADDLDSYLRGDPVVARPPTTTYRMWRWVQRHRRTVALAAVALLPIGAAAVAAIRARADAAERSRIAQRLGRELEHLESGLRIAYLLPEHDVDEDRRRLAVDLEQARALVDRSSGEAASAGRVVLARARLLLDEPEAARRELELAGSRLPEAQLTLGQTLLALHRRAARDLELYAGVSRKVRAAELRAAYLVPAAAALARAGPTGVPTTVSAELAVAEGRGDDALAIARDIAARDPWGYDARVLIGRVLLDRAEGRLLSSGCDGVPSLLDEAARELRGAREVARSLPDAHGGECAAAAMAVSCSSPDPEPAFAEAATACERADKVDLRSGDALNHLARAAQEAASLSFMAGRDPTAMIDTVLRLTGRARSLRPDERAPLFYEGSALGVRAEVELRGGKDPRPTIERSLSALRQFNRLRPTGRSLVNTAQVLKTMGNYLEQVGEDPREAYREGIATAERAAELTPGEIIPFYALGNLAVDAGTHDLERGADPSPWYATGQRAFARVIELRPEAVVAYNGLGNINWGLGVYRAGAGDDPTASFEASLVAYRKALDLDPAYFILAVNLAEVLRYLASYRIVHGGDPRPLLDEARRQLEVPIARKPPNLSDVLEERAALELAAARAGDREATAAALALLRPLPVSPRRMALRAIAVAYDGTRRHGEEAASLRRWAGTSETPEARIVDAALDAGAGVDARAILEASARSSVFLRDELRPLMNGSRPDPGRTP